MGLAWDVCVVGAGAAGLMAGIYAARGGARTAIIERNHSAGHKLLVTGGGRCNITHEASVEEFVAACEPLGRFLWHALYTFGPRSIRSFFHALGVPTLVEPSGDVFPVSNRAVDIRRALVEQATEAGAKFLYNRRVLPLEKTSEGFILHCDDEAIETRKVIIATGGVSWPQTGSTGDGYAMAASAGHGIIEPVAILVPLVVRELWIGNLQGVSLDPVQLRAGAFSIVLGVSKGPIVFTQDGIGGPAALDMSRKLANRYSPGREGIELQIDLFSGLERHHLDQKLIAWFGEHPRKQIPTLLSEFVPRAISDQFCRAADCVNITGAQLPKSKRDALLDQMKGLTMHVVSTRPIREATVTRGGVDTSQIEPTTMESKICPGLYFAGEVINVDGPCGGYNLTIAFATGALAGKSVLTQSRKEAKKI